MASSSSPYESDASRSESGGRADDSAAELYTAIGGQDKAPPLPNEIAGDILNTDEIFRRVVVTADEEYSRSVRLLFFSGLAAGLIMSLSFLGMSAIKGSLSPDASHLLPAFLYPLGFLFVVLGRYQLFTENTLTPVTLVLTRLASIPRLLRIWGLVFGANVLGTGIAAFYFAKTSILDAEMAVAATEIAQHALDMDWGETFYKGTIAGWLVAGMVWLNHAARSVAGRVLVIFFLMYCVSATDLAHCIVGSAEGLYLVFDGDATLLEFVWGFLAPAALGNTVGGVLLVALLNYAQTRQDKLPDRDVLPWRDWLLGSANEVERARERRDEAEEQAAEEQAVKKQALENQAAKNDGA